MNIRDFKGDDGIYRIRESENWDALIKVVDGRQVYQLRNDEQGKYFKPRNTPVTGIRSTFTIRPATDIEKLHFNVCLEAGKYVDPPSLDEFNGSWADFHKEDGDYFVEKGDSTWIVRCLGGNDIYRIYTNGPKFREGQQFWGLHGKYKIRKAVQSETDHLESCISHGCYMEPPRSLNSSRELEDGYYKIKNNLGMWLVKFEKGEFIGTINTETGFFYTGGDHWDSEISASELTKDEILQLDTSIAKDEYVSLKDAKFALEFGFTGGLKTGRIGSVVETDDVSTESETDTVFKGEYEDFKPEDGDYVLKCSKGNSYISKYKNGKIVGEVADHLGSLITEETWRPHHKIEARRAAPIETKQLDASISKGKYVSSDEALARNLGKPDAIIENSDGNLVPVDFKSHNSVFDLQNCKTVLGINNNGIYLDEVRRLQEVIAQQQLKINKLSETWMQKLKNMIGPLV